MAAQRFPEAFGDLEVFASWALATEQERTAKRLTSKMEDIQDQLRQAALKRRRVNCITVILYFRPCFVSFVFCWGFPFRSFRFQKTYFNFERFANILIFEEWRAR